MHFVSRFLFFSSAAAFQTHANLRQATINLSDNVNLKEKAGPRDPVANVGNLAGKAGTWLLAPVLGYMENFSGKPLEDKAPGMVEMTNMNMAQGFKNPVVKYNAKNKKVTIEEGTE